MNELVQDSGIHISRNGDFDLLPTEGYLFPAMVKFWNSPPNLQKENNMIQLLLP